MRESLVAPPTNLDVSKFWRYRRAVGWVRWHEHILQVQKEGQRNQSKTIFETFIIQTSVYHFWSHSI